jgi:5'-3' exoribonuclease 1
MTDPKSPIIEFYPPVADIKAGFGASQCFFYVFDSYFLQVDMNGKRNPWEGVTLLPFIQEEKMMDAIRLYVPDSTLNDEERRRNTFG